MSAPPPAASPDGTDGPAGTEQLGGPDELAVVLVHLGDRIVALDAAAAVGVARADNVTRVRGPAAALRGLVAVHGKVAAVVDPRVALGLEPLDDEVVRQQLLVVAGDAGRFALLVDDLDVASLPVARRASSGAATATATVVVQHGDEGLPLVELADLVAPVLAATVADRAPSPGAGS